MRTTIRDQLSSVVQDLITTLAENRVLQAEDIAKRDELFYSKSSSFSIKLSSLARQGIGLISQDPGIAFDVEYAIIAQALDIVGDSPVADQYWQEAVKTSPSDYYRIVNKRGYADFLIRQGRHQAGRKQYQEALEIWDNSSDFQKFTNGYTYQMWFYSEVWNLPAPHGRAEDCYRNAKSIYESISSAPAKSSALKALETIYSKSPLGFATGMAGNNLPPPPPASN